MDYSYGVNEDYLDEDDDGIMYSTKSYCSDSEDESFSFFAPRKNKKNGHDDSSEDEFEKDMAAELNATMKTLTTPSALSILPNKSSEKGEETYYDKIYFDSDEDVDDGGESNADTPAAKKRKEKRKILTNDELFYDPLMDDEDQAWVNQNRRSYQVKNKKLRNSKGEIQASDRLPSSDAVLNCPACFTTLCLDCQRHEIYKNQYRAMFVFNCAVDKNEILHFEIKDKKKNKFKKLKESKKNRKQLESIEASSGEGTSASLSNSFEEEAKKDSFHPVKCQYCNTKVAVQDEDEVYHFFNVLSSY